MSRGAFGPLVGLALLAACQSSETPSSTSSSSAPGSSEPATARPAAREQRLFTAAISDPKTFNPITTTDNASATAIGEIFDTLVRLDPRTTEIEPSIAERWECAEDGTKCTFHLRRDVRWHDGVALTAADVVFTFGAIYDDRVPNSLRHILTVDGKRIEVQAVDDHTLRFSLPHPFAPLLNSIAAVAVVPEHVLGESLAAGTFAQQWGIDTPPEELIGSGPFRIEKYVPAQYVRLRRNPDYWRRDESGRPLPYLEERTIRIVPNQDTAYLKFLAGETHVHNPRPEEVPDLRERAAKLGIQVDEIGLETGMLFLTFNRNPAHYVENGARDPRLDWFSDRQFLRAVAHSIDKQSMIDNTMHGLGKPAVSYISPENRRFYDPGLSDYPYDLDRAREILREAGYVDRDGDGITEDRRGNRIEFNLHTNAGNQVREKMCSILVEDLTKLGMKVHYRPLDFTLLVEKLDSTYDWDAMLMGFTGGIEPHTGANLLRSDGNLHLWHPNQASPATAWEAEIDRLLDEGSRELDVDKRRQVYRRIQEILQEELPMIQTVRRTNFTAYTNALENFQPTAWGVYRPELVRFAQ